MQVPWIELDPSKPADAKSLQELRALFETLDAGDRDDDGRVLWTGSWTWGRKMKEHNVAESGRRPSGPAN